jgi:hypothetical protein
MTTQLGDFPSHDELEAWSRQPLAELQAAEREIYGAPLSFARSATDVPTKSKPGGKPLSRQRAKCAKRDSQRQKAE